jgi:hypothetical protein
VGVEQRIRSAVEDRLPHSNPAVRVSLTDLVELDFEVSAESLAEARAYGRTVAESVLRGASPVAVEAVELLAPPAVPV